MAFELLDADKKPIRGGVYVDESSSVYAVFRYQVKGHPSGLVARDSEGRLYNISFPKRLPDSGSMRDGEVDSFRLKRCSKEILTSLKYSLRFDIEMIDSGIRNLNKQRREGARNLQFVIKLLGEKNRKNN